MKQNIVLLNPPGRRLYIRDYYCSKVSQADYVNSPLDLVMISGSLAEHHSVTLIDAIVQRYSPRKTLDLLAGLKPDAIVALIGAASIDEDIAFLNAVKERLPRTRIIATGDVFCEQPENFLAETPCIDAAVLDFASAAVREYLAGNEGGVTHLAARDPEGKIVVFPSPKLSSFSVPPPRHELFTALPYRHPFIRARRFVTTTIDYGCPYQCTFCIMKTLPYKTRPVESLLEEFRHIRSLGITEILFTTQTFGANYRHARAVCQAMIDANFSFGWVCFSRVDIADRALLDLMKKAGCHTIIFGVESGSDAILKKYRKGYTKDQISRTLSYCRSIGMETVGTFILGLPDESHSTADETMALLRTIDLDYASFNVAVPRIGTELRAQALEQGLVQPEMKAMDQSGSTIAMPSRTLSREEILAYRRKAVVTFYLRPQALIRQLATIRSLDDLLRRLHQAYRLIRNTWRS